MSTDADLTDWLALARLQGVGPRTQTQILENYGSAGAFFAASERDRQHHGLPTEAIKASRKLEGLESAIETDLAWRDGASNRHIITRSDDRYPAALADIADPPAVLFVRGHPALLQNPQIAIVGSRHATPIGAETAHDFAAHLAATGLTVTSGLALGIDTAAHEGALLGGGQTLAVMATGPDRLYPRENIELAERIAETGAIVTEMSAGTPVKRGLFPRRNRIISGLSLGVLVVEAGSKSGALGSARSANEQNREVLAIPGSIHNPVARGCHALIRDGARLVESVNDVLEELRGPAARMTATLNEDAIAPEPPSTAPHDRELDADDQALLDALGESPVSFDRLLERLGLTPDILSSMLLKLELKGRVAPCSGGQYQRTTNRAGG